MTLRETIMIFHIVPAWLEILFLAFVVGVLASLLWVFPSAARADLPERERLSARLWRFFAISIAAALASGFVNLLVRTAEMSGSPLQDLFPQLPTVILKTHFGTVWLIRIAGLVLLWVFVTTGRKYRDSRPGLYVLLGIAAVVTMTESASGHAADAGDFSAAELADWLHLFAACVWGGGLLALSLAILPFFAKAGNREARSIAAAGSRFSRIAGIAVATIVLTALYQARAYVGSIDALVKAPYGRTVVAKLVLLIFLLALGAFNRYISVPRLQEWAGLPPARRGILSRLAGFFLGPLARNLKGAPVARRFGLSVRIEAFLIIGVLLCAALLRHEVPARHFMHGEHTGENGHSLQHHGGSHSHMGE